MTTASMTLKESTHIMGPKGEIIATIRPINNGNGFVLDFDYEQVEVKTSFVQLFSDSLSVHLK